MKDRSRNSTLGNLGTLFLESPRRFTRCILRGCLLGSFALIFTSAPMLAQSTTADVVGTVSDVQDRTDQHRYP